MRIVAGKYRGRALESPSSNIIRPTSDKIRGAIFNALLSRIDLREAFVADLFSGSGALGLEALSRGAAQCLFMDKSHQSLSLTKRNAANLNIDTGQTLFQQGEAQSLPANALDHTFNLAFLDPPYRKSLIPPTLDALHNGRWLHDGAWCIVECEDDAQAIDAIKAAAHFTCEKNKTYGSTHIMYLRYIP